jgi:hypothetical protein
VVGAVPGPLPAITVACGRSLGAATSAVASSPKLTRPPDTAWSTASADVTARASRHAPLTTARRMRGTAAATCVSGADATALSTVAQ